MQKFSEKSLVQKLDRLLKKEFDTNISFREFSAGYGIADLVFAADFSFSKKKIKRTPITNFYALKILLSLDKEVFSKEDVVTMSGSLEKNNYIKQLNFLVKNDYIKKNSSNKYQKTVDKNLNPIKKVVAIEVKLSDHKGGLLQAKRYQYFADESYLAILKEAEKNINVEEFNKSNIGLILFDPKNNSIEIKYPQSTFGLNNRINLYAKELMLEKFLSLSF